MKTKLPLYAVFSSDSFLPWVCPLAPASSNKASQQHEQQHRTQDTPARLPTWLSCKNPLSNRRTRTNSQPPISLCTWAESANEPKLWTAPARRRAPWQLTPAPFLGSRNQRCNSNCHRCRKRRNQAAVAESELSLAQSEMHLGAGDTGQEHFTPKGTPRWVCAHASPLQRQQASASIQQHPARPQHHPRLILESNAALRGQNTRGMWFHSSTHP